MIPFKSDIDPSSNLFEKNRADMMALCDHRAELLARTVAASEAKRPQFEKRGQLTPRARLAALLDPGAPFLELGAMGGFKMDGKPADKSVPGGGVITGIGFVSGVRVMVIVDDAAINAGAFTAAGGTKRLRAQDIALRQKLPLVQLVESAGGDLLNYKVEGFVTGGRLFANLSRLSAAGCPVITVLHGSATAGGAYVAGLSDYIIGVTGKGRAFLAGPPLLKAATGEDATEEELGGVEMHAEISGLVDYQAPDDWAGVQMARHVVDGLDWPKEQLTPAAQPTGPTHDVDELLGAVPVDFKEAYDVRDVITRIMDGPSFEDFKPDYGPAIVTVRARIMGRSVAILGSNGPIDNPAAHKATQFIQLADQAGIPLVFLQNVTGYLVGTAHEQAGMVKNGSKMIQAMTNTRVPRITIQIGAGYGAGAYGMAGMGFDPDFMMIWPSASTGVMGGAQAAKTMSIVMTAAAKRKGFDPDPEMVKAQEAQITKLFDDQADAFTTSGRGLDDGMIDPRDTRRVLTFLLETVLDDIGRRRQPHTKFMCHQTIRQVWEAPFAEFQQIWLDGGPL